MKQLFIGMIFLFGGLNTANAELIPLKDFAQKSQFKSVKISPDGKHIAFTYEEGTEVKLAIMNLKEKKIVSSYHNGDNREVDDFWWANNKRIMMLATDITGALDGAAQNPLLVSGNIDGSKRNVLWDFQRAGLSILSLYDKDPKKIIVGKNHWADKGGTKLHTMNILNGKISFMQDSPRTRGSSDSVILEIQVDLNDNPRLAIEFDQDPDVISGGVTYLHVKQVDGEWEVLPFPVNPKRKDRPNLNGIGFSVDNTKFYFTSNHDLDHDGTVGLFEFNFKTRKIKFLFRHPDVDILEDGVLGSKGQLIGVAYEAGYPAVHYLKDKNVQDEVVFHKAIQASFKGQTISISSYSKDGLLATVSVRSDKNPGDFYLFDRATNKMKYLASSRPHIKPKTMAAVEAFTMTARDGLKMYGQMTIPKGKELKNLPMVVFPHGGPYGILVSDRWRWDWRAQLLASRGYLVLQLNYRGSGGYGGDFERAGSKEWGAKMQDDLTDATLWAIKQGYAAKDRICIHGISYGGYASMQGVVKEPDLYKCAIPEAGPYEIDLQWAKADSFKNNRKRGESYKKLSFGDGKGVIRERSPVYHVDKLKAALLIVHGSKDVRVPIDNAYLLEEKLKAAGKPYETYYKEDGHGFQNVDYRVESFERIFAFLDKHIGK